MSFFKPKQTMHRMPSDMMVGELLVKAGIISQRQLDECIRLAGNKRLHLGQMLIMSGYINSRDLQAAVDAQSMLREKNVEGDMAIRCLNVACKAGRSFPEVVEEQKNIQEENEANQAWTLGHLLLESEACAQEQLDAAIQRSHATGIPMGRILVLNGALDDKLLTKALDLMVKIRDGLIEKDEAIEAMRAAAGITDGSPMTQNLLLPPQGKKIRLGDLMIRAQVMSESDVLSAVELGLTYRVLIGQIMVEQGYVAVELVEAALEVQEHIEQDSITIDKGVEVLSHIRDHGGAVSDMVGEIVAQSGVYATPDALSFEKLLTLARVVSPDQIQEAFNICRQTPEALAKILCLTGFIQQDVHDAVLRCHQLLDGGKLNQDDALVALDYCFNKNGNDKSFDQVLAELGWKEDAQRKASLPPSQPSPETVPAATREEESFNMLEHFGLSESEQEEAAEPQPQPQADEAATTVGTSTTDMPTVNLTEQLMEPEAASIPEPEAQDDGKLAGILDRLGADDDTTSDAAAEQEETPAEPAPAEPAEPEPVVEDSAPPKRPKVDREALKAQSMTMAPNSLKIEESLTEQPEEEEGPADESKTEKKAAVGAAMYRLAESYFDQGDFAEAQKVYEKILAIRQTEVGPQSKELVDDLNKLAEVIYVQGNFRQAEPFVRRAVTILESSEPVDMLKLSDAVRTLAGLYFQQGKYEPCLPLLEHALMMKKLELGEFHSDVGGTLREYAKLLKKLGRKEEADKHYRQAKEILARNKKK